MKRPDLHRGQAVTLGQLTNGEHGLRRDPNRPIFSIMVDGRRSALWIGNDAYADKWCFDTVESEAKLRCIAEGILAALKVRASAPETEQEA